MRRILGVVVLAGCLLLSAGAAFAGVCVQLDAAKDTLTEQERSAAVLLLSQALENEHQQVVTTGCMATYTVSHVKFGNSVTIQLQGPQGSRNATARSMEEVPATYSQMVKSLLTGQAMGTGNDTVDRNNVTAAQAAPKRVEADSLWYARLGYGAALGSAFNHGPAFGFGYRYELDNLGIDLSFLNFMMDTGGNSSSSTGGSRTAITGSWIKLMGLYFRDPMANRSVYFGGGLSWGGVGVFNNGDEYSGSGIQGEVVVGYELLRATTIRLFTQFDATLPFFPATHDFTAANSNSVYVPTFVIAMGIGWGRAPLQRVQILQ